MKRLKLKSTTKIRTLNCSKARYTFKYFFIGGQYVPVHDYRQEKRPVKNDVVLSDVNDLIKQVRTKATKPPYLPPKIKENTHNELYSLLLNQNILTDNIQDVEKLIDLLDCPLIIFDFNNSLIKYQYLDNIIYYGYEYQKKNVIDLIENRANRQQNKVKTVSIIINSLDDYKIDLNYIIKRGAISDVHILAVGSKPPKKANFDVVINNGLLTMSDGEQLNI